MSLPRLLIQLALLPILLAAVTGMVRFRRLPPELRYLAVLAVFVLVLEALARLLAWWHQPNLLLMPIYTAGEFCLLVLVYRQALQSTKFTRAAPWLMGLFIAYLLLDSWLAAEPTRFRPNQQVIQSVLLIGLTGLYFRKVLHELRVQQLEREPMFWVSTGLFIYYVGYIQIALFSNYLLSYSLMLNRNIWAIHALLSMVLYGSYCVALWMRPQK
jgi:hypothetical protein